MAETEFVHLHSYVMRTRWILSWQKNYSWSSRESKDSIYCCSV